jgi:hypothetical protein
MLLDGTARVQLQTQAEEKAWNYPTPSVSAGLIIP